MALSLQSGCVHGVDGVAVRVEVDVLSLLPVFTVVGLAASSVKEARERVRSAIQAAGLPFPRRRITINLAPADLPKHGTGLDLPIALGVIAAAWSLDEGKAPWSTPPAALGELGLDGRLRPVRGVLPAAEALAAAGARRLIVPRDNAAEAALVPGLAVLPADTLTEAWLAARGGGEPWAGGADDDAPAAEPDLADVRGQPLGRRLVEVAAAGGHGLLLEGPPGAGKSMLARRLVSLLPRLSEARALEVTRIRSAAGLLRGAGLVRTPPLRAPHHTASAVAVIGGGSPLRPGEVTLAHHGVLLLDEAPEFPRSVLESLRQPMEDGVVTVARVGGTARLPARFQAVLTRNPCPCGACGARPARCTQAERDRYDRRLSGPLLDRVDLAGWIEPTPPDALLRGGRGEASAAVRTRVEAARLRQARRWAGSGRETNGEARLDDCLPAFDAAARRALEDHAVDAGSVRSVQQLARVALTLADLAGQDVAAEHVEEAALLTRAA